MVVAPANDEGINAKDSSDSRKRARVPRPNGLIRRVTGVASVRCRCLAKSGNCVLVGAALANN